MARHSSKKRKSSEPSRSVKVQPQKTSPANRKILLLQVLAIVAMTFWIFWPVMDGGWLWDDDSDISLNPVIHDPNGLWKIWFQPGALIDYYPIKASAQWLQWQLWHTNTFGYHLTNVILHIISALLVWNLLSKFGLKLAWLGGLLFAVHPIQVESVAWMAELKNTLSLPPLLLAMCFYIDYDTYKKPKDYFLSLGLFLTAMLCKTTMVMFPIIILLYAWWKRATIRWPDFKAGIPFFAISFILGMVTIFVGGWFAQSHNTPPKIIPISGFFSHLALAGTCLSFYFYKCFWPLPLLPIYPQWAINPYSPFQFLSWLVLGGAIAWFWTKRADWGKHVLLGLGFFLINLLPFIGFYSVSYMGIAWVMDHFLYIPVIGLIGLLVAGLGDIKDRLSASFRSIAVGMITLIVALMSWESHEYAGRFVDQETLWTYTLTYNKQAWLAHNNLGNILQEKGLVPEAIEHFKEALLINPGYALGHYNLGNALAITGQTSEAMAQYEQAIKIDPDNPQAHYNFGNAFAQLGQFSQAIDQYTMAIKANPAFAEAHNNLGNALLLTKKFPEAIEHFKKAIKINPDYATAHSNLASAFEQTGQISQAIDQYEEVLKLAPDNTEARHRLEQLQAGQKASDNN